MSRRFHFKKPFINSESFLVFEERLRMVNDAFACYLVIIKIEAWNFSGNVW